MLLIDKNNSFTFYKFTPYPRIALRTQCKKDKLKYYYC